VLSMAFTVRSVSEPFARAMRWHLEPFHKVTGDQHAFPVDLFVQQEDSGTDPPTYSSFFASEAGIRHASLSDHLQHLLWAVNHGVAERVRDFLLLHAGAVASDGGAIVLPAKMDSGKSSTVVAMLEAGFGYLSDEFGAVDPITGAVYPVPKRISIGWEAMSHFRGLEDRLHDPADPSLALPQRFLRPEDVGSTPAGPARPRAIVVPVRDFEGPPRLEPMSSAAAVEAMAASCFNLFRYGERGVILLTRVAKEAPAFRLLGGTPRERGAFLRERFL
jgi:hypothetical protein